MISLMIHLYEGERCKWKKLFTYMINHCMDLYLMSYTLGFYELVLLTVLGTKREH